MAELAPGDVFAGHRIEGVAGRGGMGVVYKATHLALDITVALKLIKPELAEDPGFRERFQRESRLAASIEHPHVLPVRHAGEEGGLLYITMRYVEGTDLRQMIDQQGKLSPVHAAGYLAQIASALDAAHARGLVHRDVKPANVLIESREGVAHAYLTDFGLTRHATSAGGLTKTGHWVGTLDYVAPEQIEGKPVDARADIYALGCVLYEMVSGETPFLKESEVATMYAHLNEPPPPLSTKVPASPPALDQVVHRAMAKDPRDRYPSAGDFGHAASAAVQGTPIARPEQSVAVGKAAPASAEAQPPVTSPTAAAAAAAPPPTVPARPPTAAPPPTPPPPSSVTPPPTAAPPPPGAPPPAAPPPGAPRGPRRRALLFGGGAAGLVAVVVGVLAAAGAFGGGSGATTTSTSSSTSTTASTATTTTTPPAPGPGAAALRANLIQKQGLSPKLADCVVNKLVQRFGTKRIDALLRQSTPPPDILSGARQAGRQCALGR